MLNFSNGPSYEFDKLKTIRLHIIDDIKTPLTYDVIYNYVTRQSHREKFISTANSWYDATSIFFFSSMAAKSKQSVGLRSGLWENLRNWFKLFH